MSSLSLPIAPIAAALLACVASSPQESAPETTGAETLPSNPPEVVLVPLGVPRLPLGELEEFYRSSIGLEVHVTDPIPLPLEAFGTLRRQFAAQDVVEHLRQYAKDHELPESTVVIGVTFEDLYIKKKGWRYAFGYRAGSFGTISGARMQEAFWGEPRNDELQTVRLRKMLTKYIGLLHFDLEMNDDPTSVLFSGILGVGDLDIVDEATMQRDIVQALAEER